MLDYKLKQLIARIHQLVRMGSYYLEYFFWLIFSLSKFKVFPKNIKNVLIVNYGALGDMFSCSRIICNLVKSNPNKKFYLVGYDTHLNKIKKFEKELGFKILNEKEIDKEKFDMVLLFSFTDRLKNKFKNKGFSVGNEYSSIRESLKSTFNLFINRKVFPRFVKRHKLLQEIRICKKAGLKIKYPLQSLNKKRVKNVNLFIKKNKIKKFIVIHPCGLNFSKIIGENKIPRLAWPLKRFSKIADYIINKYDYDIVITGIKDEKFILDKIKKECNNKKRVNLFCGDVEEFTDLMNRGGLLISIDTSAIHVAELVGTPIIALFGPTFPEEVGPFGDFKKQIVIQHRNKCIIDRQKGVCKKNRNRCMESINLEEVKKAVDKIL